MRSLRARIGRRSTLDHVIDIELQLVVAALSSMLDQAWCIQQPSAVFPYWFLQRTGICVCTVKCRCVLHKKLWTYSSTSSIYVLTYNVGDLIRKFLLASIKRMCTTSSFFCDIGIVATSGECTHVIRYASSLSAILFSTCKFAAIDKLKLR